VTNYTNLKSYKADYVVGGGISADKRQVELQRNAISIQITFFGGRRDVYGSDKQFFNDLEFSKSYLIISHLIYDKSSPPPIVKFRAFWF
jgi:hypothetical protein